jgi:hypothetical protein
MFYLQSVLDRIIWRRNMDPIVSVSQAAVHIQYYIRLLFFGRPTQVAQEKIFCRSNKYLLSKATIYHTQTPFCRRKQRIAELRTRH